MRSWLAALLVALGCVLAWPTTATAQVSNIDTPAFGIERFWLEPGPGGFLAGTDAAVLEPKSMHVAVMATLMKRPIVLTPLQGGEAASVPVRIRLGYELAIARGITKRLQLGVAFPVIAAQDGDRLQGIDLSEESLDPVALGDARIHAKFRLQERPTAKLGYGLAMHLRLPTGNQNHFAGEAGVVLSWGLVADYQWRGLRVAGNLGLRIRTKEVILLSPARAHSNEILATAAAEYRLPGLPVGALLEYAKVNGDGRGPSPGEARIGVAAYVLPRATLKVATARGTTPDEVGSPAWRVMASFAYEGR